MLIKNPRQSKLPAPEFVVILILFLVLDGAVRHTVAFLTFMFQIRGDVAGESVASLRKQQNFLLLEIKVSR